MVITGVTGQQSWNNHLAKLMLFSVDINAKTETLVTSNTLRNGGSRVDVINARNDTTIDLGKFTRFTSDIFAPGQLLKVYAEKMAAFTSQHKKAALYFQLRNGAALRKIKITLDDSKGALREAFVMAPCDILTLAQAIEEGAPEPKYTGFRVMHETSAVSRLFDLSVVEEEVTAKQQISRVSVTNAQGNIVAVPVAVRTRKLRF